MRMDAVQDLTLREVPRQSQAGNNGHAVVVRTPLVDAVHITNGHFPQV